MLRYNLSSLRINLPQPQSVSSTPSPATSTAPASAPSTDHKIDPLCSGTVMVYSVAIRVTGCTSPLIHRVGVQEL